MKSVIVHRSTRSMLAIAIPIFLVMTFLLGRNSALTSPIMGGDEYAYYAGARTLPDLSGLSARDPYIQWAPNLVFMGLGKLFFLISKNPDLLMKEFNAISFSSSLLLICIVLYWLTHGRFSYYSPILISLTPFSAYSAYFMPETLYVFIFLLLVAVILYLIPEREWLASSIGGVLVGFLILTKPHGISVFIAVFITILSLAFSPGSLRIPWKSALVSACLFVLSTYLSEVVLGWIITGTLSWNPLNFVGKAYNNYVGGSMEVFDSVKLLVQMAGNAIGHMIVLLFMCAIPLSYSIGWLLSFSRTAPDNAPQLSEIRRFYFLIVFTLVATLTTLAMTVNFTVQVSQFARLHGRYYSYILFLYILGYFVLKRKANLIIPPGGWRLWGGIGLLSSILMFWVQRTFTIYPWDYPEIFSISLWTGYGTQFPGWTLIMLGFIVYGLIIIKPKLHSILFPFFILILFLASNYKVIEWQVAHSENVGSQAEQGRAIRDLIPENERNRGMIIGNDRYNKMPYFLFGFSSDAWVRDVPPGSSITMDMLPPDTDWIILLDNYDLDIPIKSSMSVGKVWLGWISPNASIIHESIDVWDGSPLQLTFGIGGSTQMLDQFNEPEAWGTWSATDGARILLPVLVSGKVRIEVIGWIKPESSTQSLHLLIGSTSVPVNLGTNKGKSCVTVSISEPSQVITLDGVEPFRQNLWDQAQAIALIGLNIYKESDVLHEPCSVYTPLE